MVKSGYWLCLEVLCGSSRYWFGICIGSNLQVPNLRMSNTHYSMISFSACKPQQELRLPTSVLYPSLFWGFISRTIPFFLYLLLHSTHVFLGCSLLPCSFHVRAWLFVVVGGLQSVCPIHHQCLFLILASRGIWLVWCHRSILLIVWGHHIWNVFLQAPIEKILENKIDLTLLLKILIWFALSVLLSSIWFPAAWINDTLQLVAQVKLFKCS